MLLRTIAGLSMLLSGLIYILSGLALWLLPDIHSLAFHLFHLFHLFQRSQLL